MLLADPFRLFENDAEAIECAAGDAVFRQGDTGHVIYDMGVLAQRIGKIDRLAMPA